MQFRLNAGSVRSLALFLTTLLLIVEHELIEEVEPEVNVSGLEEPLTDTSNTFNGTESKPQRLFPAFVLDSSAQDDEREIDFPTLRSRYILKHNRPPPTGYQQWYNYANDRKCYLDRYDAIYKDLAPFEGLGKEEYRRRLELAKNAPSTSVIEVKNGKIANNNHYVDHFVQFLPDMIYVTNNLDEPRVLFDVTVEHNWTMTKEDEKNLFHSPARGVHAAYIKKYCKVHSKERPFVGLNEKHGYLIEPSSSSYTHQLLPILSPARIDPCFSDILVPSGYYIGSAQRAAPGEKIPWEDRKPVLYWRGRTSGGHATGTNYENFHRQRMTEFHIKNPTLYDIAFTDTVQCDQKECQDMKERYPFTDSLIPFEDNFKHKFLIDIDGNTFSGRYLALLFSGSLVFKPTIFTEFFRDWLKPYVHYIPVEMDLSDLDDKVQWALQHDKEAKQIALNGQRFVKKHLREQHRDCYTYLLMLELARLEGSS